MKKTVVLLLIFTVMTYIAVRPSYAREPAQDSVITLLNQIMTQITSGQQQLEGLPTKVDALTTKVDALTTKVDALTTKVDALSDKFDAGLTVKVNAKSYYLTKDPYPANQAITACDNGFHMASLWEILDPTVLHYDQDSSRSYQRSSSDDQGSGPPSDIDGWIRTGNESSVADDVGTANCANWSSTSGSDDGSVVRFLEAWHISVPIENNRLEFQRIAPWWLPFTLGCDASARVWCVED